MTTNWIKTSIEQNEESFNWKAVILILFLFTLFIGAQVYFVLEYFLTK